MIRSELRDKLLRWREPLFAGAAALFGLWLFFLGGWLLMPIGVIITTLALGWVVIAIRRVRFLQAVAAPGIVEVDEGQVGYLGPTFGGFVSLDELAELRLTEHHGKRQWRMKTRAGEVLLVPVDAAGAEMLYDAFAALPGIDMAALAAALERGVETLPLWQRSEPSPPDGRAITKSH